MKSKITKQIKNLPVDNSRITIIENDSDSIALNKLSSRYDLNNEKDALTFYALAKSTISYKHIMGELTSCFEFDFDNDELKATEDFLTSSGSTLDTLIGTIKINDFKINPQPLNYKRMAVEYIKTSLTIERLAQEWNIVASKESLEQEVQGYIDSHFNSKNVQTFNSQKDPNKLEKVSKMMLQTKVIDHIRKYFTFDYVFKTKILARLHADYLQKLNTKPN